jgi:hypothetical protein
MMTSETGEAELHDLPHSGCPVTAVCLEVLQHDGAINREDGRITNRQLACSLSPNKGSVSHIIQDLGYSKVFTRCASQSLTVKQLTKRRAISSMLLVCFQAQGETFPSWVVTADETWFHHFELEKKRQSAEWRYHQSPQKKEFKRFLSVGKVMITVFCDCAGRILVAAMLRRETFDSDAYASMFTERRKCFS